MNRIIQTSIVVCILMAASALQFTYHGSDPIYVNGENVDSAPSFRATSFTNVTSSVGLAGISGNFLAWGDYDNDGDQDLLVNGGKLLENSGAPDYHFNDISVQVGISGGSYGTWADWNNDGNLDLFVAGSSKLYQNTGEPDYQFQDVTTISGIKYETYQTGSGWGDYDQDGFCDLFIARGENWPDGDPIYYPNTLYHNNGDGTFTNVTAQAGVDESSSPTYSRGVEWGDYNNDGLLDLYISNYRQLPNYLYENNGDGTFTDVAPSKGVADCSPREGGNLDPYNRPGHSVGSIWGDYDNDGDLDLWVTNLNHKDARTSDDSLLYQNSGAPDFTFTNVRDESGIAYKPYVAPNEGDELMVGCAWGDYDNDGFLDLFVPQIYDEPDYAYSFFYHNEGDGTFTEVSDETGVRVWDTYAGCFCDYDNDGDLDLLTNGKGEATPGYKKELHLYRNDGTPNHWLKVQLNGSDSNRAAIGARVTIELGTGSNQDIRTQMREVEGGMGCHGMQNSIPVEFGLGDYDGKVKVIVRWPNGLLESRSNILTDRLVRFTEPTEFPDLTIDSIGFSPPSPYAGSIVNITARVSNGGQLQCTNAKVQFYEGSLSIGKKIGDTQMISALQVGSSISVSVETSFKDDGDYNITVEVFDVGPNEIETDNNLASSELRVSELPPIPPPEAVLKAPRTQVQLGEMVNFDGSDSFGDAAIESYLFDTDDGTQSGWLSDPYYSYEYQEEGTYKASLTVKDIYGQLSSNDAELTIVVLGEGERPNEEPTADITLISPNPAQLGEEVYFSGDGQDPDGRITEYRWTSSIDGALSSSQTFFTDDLSQGTHEIQFRVRDDDDLWSDPDETTLIVSTDLTTITIKLKSPGAGLVISPQTPFTVKGSASSDRVPVDKVEVQLDGGSWMRASGTTSWSYDVSTAGLSAGVHTISIRAHAGAHVSDLVSMSFTIIGEDDDDTSVDDGDLSVLDRLTDPSVVFALLLLIGVLGIVVFYIIDRRSYPGNKKLEEAYEIEEFEDDEDLL